MGVMEPPNSRIALALISRVQNRMNRDPVFQEHHLARLCWLHVAHLDPQMNVERKPVTNENQISCN